MDAEPACSAREMTVQDFLMQCCDQQVAASPLPPSACASLCMGFRSRLRVQTTLPTTKAAAARPAPPSASAHDSRDWHRNRRPVPNLRSQASPPPPPPKPHGARSSVKAVDRQTAAAFRWLLLRRTWSNSSPAFGGPPTPRAPLRFMA